MKSYQFGQHFIKFEHIFFQTKFSFAFLNNKPLSKGHVLICPKKYTKRLNDLQINEIDHYLKDLQNVRNFLYYLYKKPVKMGIQDGEEAGQSVNHLHTHLIPCNKHFISDPKRVILENEEIRDLSEIYKNSMKDFFYEETSLKIEDRHLMKMF